MIAYALTDSGDSVTATSYVSVSKVITDKPFGSHLLIDIFAAPYEVQATTLYPSFAVMIDEVNKLKKNALKHNDEFELVSIGEPVKSVCNEGIAKVIDTIQFTQDELDKIKCFM